MYAVLNAKLHGCSHHRSSEPSRTVVHGGLLRVITVKRKGAITVSNEPTGPGDQETVSAWKNIGKTIFLIAALVAAWFMLEWLMGGK
jgi:hypothetical protein